MNYRIKISDDICNDGTLLFNIEKEIEGIFWDSWVVIKGNLLLGVAEKIIKNIEDLPGDYL